MITIACHTENNAVRPVLETSLEKAMVYTDSRAFRALMKSALILSSEKKVYRMFLRIETDKEGSHLIFHLQNTPLAEKSFENKTVLIRNEINLHFLRHFGGSYQINPLGKQGPSVVFIYPLLAAH